MQVSKKSEFLVGLQGWKSTGCLPQSISPDNNVAEQVVCGAKPSKERSVKQLQNAD